ncbi:MAG: WYL domain-containing protein [Oscillospiraceae bacterium]
MNEGRSAPRREELGYSNSFRTMAMVWDVLYHCASREKPMKTREIYEELCRRYGTAAPSESTVGRTLSGGKECMDALFFQTVTQAGTASVVGDYSLKGTLHVVVENAEGEPLQTGGLTAQFVRREGERVPSPSTLEKMLKEGFPEDLRAETFPFALTCLMQKTSPMGKVRYLPYGDSVAAGTGKKGGTRYFYLKSPLTDAEWRIFADMVQVFPYITEGQTKKFLAVLDRARPRHAPRALSRYAYKRGPENQFRNITVLDEAIRGRKKVRIVYGEYRLVQENGWVPRLLPREKNGVYEGFEPYALLWSNGYYYLAGKDRGLMNLRVDRILEASILEEGYTPPENFDAALYRDCSPIMYPGTATVVALRCQGWMVNTILDFFGPQAQFSAPGEDGAMEVRLNLAPAGVKLFALQYVGGVEVLAPEKLRQEVAQALEEGAARYRS